MKALAFQLIFNFATEINLSHTELVTQKFLDNLFEYIVLLRLMKPIHKKTFLPNRFQLLPLNNFSLTRSNQELSQL